MAEHSEQKGSLILESLEEGRKLPGTEILGSGYDVLGGYYADPRSCLVNLFDFPAEVETVQIGNQEFSKSTGIVYHSSIGTDLDMSSGKSIQEYTKEINSKTKLEGNYSFLSASIEADIGIKSAQKSENEFSKAQYNVKFFTLQLPPHHSKMLKPQIKDDIDNMSDLVRLFDMYGTYYLAGILMGGAASSTSSTSTSTFNSSLDVSVAAKIAFQWSIGGLSAEEQAQYKQQVDSFNESSETTVRTTGGKPGIKFPAEIGEWSDSILDYMAFVDYLGSRSLVGIWELASTRERQDELHKFYHKYCRFRQMQIIPLLRARVVPFAQMSRLGSNLAGS